MHVLRSLTKREMDALQLIAEGYDNRAIAALLEVSDASVEKHSARIFRKLRVRTSPGRNARVMAALIFHGVVSPAPAPLEASAT